MLHGREKIPNHYFQDSRFIFVISNRKLLFCTMTNVQIAINAVTVIEPIAVDLNLQYRDGTIYTQINTQLELQGNELRSSLYH